MADNYLERRMEDYRNGRLKPRSTKSSTRRATSQTATLNHMRVYVTAGTSTAGIAIIRHLRQAGCRVAFCDTDNHKGSHMAQQTGSQFHSMTGGYNDISLTRSIDHVFTHWGGLDVLIDTADIVSPHIADLLRDRGVALMLLHLPDGCGSASALLPHVIRSLADTSTVL